MSKESESSDFMLGLIILLIIGGLIYIGKNKSKDEFPINSITESTDSIIETSDDIKDDNLVFDEAKIDELIKKSKRVGSTGPDLTTDEGVKEAIDNIYEYNKDSDPEFDVNKAISAIYEDSRKAKFCKEYTKTCSDYSNMKQSYFCHDGDVIIQKMYISDIAGGYGKKYRIIVEESNQEGYIDTMASEMVNKYKEIGVFDEFDKQGFTRFQLYLISEDQNEIISKIYSIY